MKKYLLTIIIFYLTLQIKAQTVSDVDGNTYNTVTIGTQIWMKENLKTTKYNDGLNIPEITDSSSWGSTLNTDRTTPTYCWYRNDKSSYKDLYGALYNWYVVKTEKLCPSGWHVPTDDEWTILTTYLGGDSVAGGKLKESGLTHWSSPNKNANNSSGFTALPGGNRWSQGRFNSLGTACYLWSSTEDPVHPISAYSASVYSYNYSVMRYMADTWKTRGLSVRCLKDNNTSSLNNVENLNANIIFPNPAQDKLYIRNDKLSNAQILILDLHGKQVICRQMNSNPIDISNLSKGIYLVKIVDSGNIIVYKLIKE
jgi:uncharacterized protein (TIGR02145 family)